MTQSVYTKEDIYKDVTKQIAAVLEGEANITARMVTMTCLLHHAFEDFFWTGFYLVDPENPEELVIGPYQGTLGCLRIPFGKGVCGTAASTQKTHIVEDVHAFPGHIACDSRSESEIVVPVLDSKGALFGVFDVDSTRLSAFDTADENYLTAITKMLFA